MKFRIKGKVFNSKDTKLKAKFKEVSDNVQTRKNSNTGNKLNKSKG